MFAYVFTNRHVEQLTITCTKIALNKLVTLVCFKNHKTISGTPPEYPKSYSSVGAKKTQRAKVDKKPRKLDMCPADDELV